MRGSVGLLRSPQTLKFPRFEAAAHGRWAGCGGSGYICRQLVQAEKLKISTLNAKRRLFDFMRNGLCRLFFFGFFAFCEVAQGSELFVNCESASDSSAYKPLMAYLSLAKIKASHCQRLNNSEFLYLTDRNVHYCTFSKSPFGCLEDSSGSWYPNLQIAAKFRDRNGKAFVLFKTMQLTGGLFGTGYQVFYFTSGSKAGRGYVVQSLTGIGEWHGGFSDGGEPCSNLNENESATELLNSDIPYEILNTTKGRVTLAFYHKQTQCNTSAISILESRAVWSGDKFVQKTTLVGVP